MNNPAKKALFLASLFGVMSAMISLTACPGSLEDPERFREAGACADVPNDILKAKCATQAGCHSTKDMSAGLDLQAPNVGTRLLGKVSGTSGETDLLIDPTKPQSSLLYTKITAPPFGAKMPFGGTIDPSSTACILTWIESVVNAEDGGAIESGSANDAMGE